MDDTHTPFTIMLRFVYSIFQGNVALLIGSGRILLVFYLFYFRSGWTNAPKGKEDRRQQRVRRHLSEQEAAFNLIPAKEQKSKLPRFCANPLVNLVR
jgi:hypothetical protein